MSSEGPRESISLDEVCRILDSDPDDTVYFRIEPEENQETFGSGVLDLRVHEVVNRILSPYDFENYSEYKFKRIAGGSAHSANLIENYENGRGSVKYGYTKLEDIVEYCQTVLESSYFVPLERVLEWFEWSKKAVNEEFITRQSSRKERYDIEAILDITKGHMPEEAFKLTAEERGYELRLDRRLYGGTRDTDEGQDVLRIGEEEGSLREPERTVQIKDVQWFYLVPENEFTGSRSADIYVGYKTHWRKGDLGQRLFRLFDTNGEMFGEFEPLEGIRIEERGWARPDDFEYLPSGERLHGQKFRDDNYYVYWEDLRDMDSFPFEELL